MTAAAQGSAPASPAAASAKGLALVQAATQPFELTAGRLVGPGAELLKRAARAAQFMLVAESHNDAVTPRFVTALFADLNREAGYQYLALEQDPYGMEAAGARPLRGDVNALAAHVKRYPFQYIFTTDEELTMVADAGRISRASRPVWGTDQVFGSTLLLEELERTAPNPRAKAAVRSLLEEARTAEVMKPDPKSGVPARHFKTSTLGSRSSTLVPRFRALREAFGSPAAGRTSDLLVALERSAQIYDYNRRASAEPVGLHSNLIREAWMKDRFLREYRAAEKRDRRAPKVVYKAGSFHTVRGLTNVNVFTLGGFLHEFAVNNGTTAVSMQLLPLGTWYKKAEDVPPEYRALNASFDPTKGSIVDLRPLRAHFHAGEKFGLTTSDERRAFRDLIFGYDFMAFLPSEDAGWKLVGPNVYN